MPVRFGAQLWVQQTSWRELCDAALTAEREGWDGVWVWDHLLAIFGPWEQPIFEGWTTLGAFAAVTSRVRLGLMVGANTVRNPGLTAKLATTLDHVSDGRAVLGIGGAWFEREHEAFGIDFGSGFGERLDRLDEAVMLMRRLLDGERIAHHEGRFYQMHDALVEPRPIQPRLPILIGGSGPKKTLRTTARYADAWNTNGELAKVRQDVATLEAHCADVGRDPAEIERTVSFPILIRDRAADAEAAWAERMRANGTPDAGKNLPYLLGSPAQVADAIRPFRDELGFHHVIVRFPAPHDRETLARIGEVRELLG
ncbi:MAG TPA: TIGR03560 family F420-dependent LLM class oxidoreductase [Candidatus Limnocylindrales bacterium]|nr:TIGR03560 family F420-dependent LLM class oxidoreductase [Candidatus Limnocylindrales bacterium]